MNPDEQSSYWGALADAVINHYGEGNSQQVFENAKERMNGNQFRATTKRLDAGINTGDIPIRDPNTGNITGYQNRDRSSGGGLAPGSRILPFKNASRTPGLDAFHAMNPDKPKPETVSNGVSEDEAFVGMTPTPASATGAGRVETAPVAGGLVNRVSFPNGINPPATGGESASTWAGIQQGNAELYKPADTRRPPEVLTQAPTWNRTGWNTTSNPDAIARQYASPAATTSNFVKKIFS